MDMGIADWLNRTTKERGWTLRYVARHSGLSHSTVARVANGEVSPSIETCNALARFFGMPVDTIYDLSGIPKEKRGDVRPVRETRIVYQVNTDELVLDLWHALEPEDQEIVRELMDRLGRAEPRIIGDMTANLPD